MQELIYPGKFELFYGPMNCGKSLRLIEIVSKLKNSNKRFVILKPSEDTRDNDFLKSRQSPQKIPALLYNEINDINSIVEKHFKNNSKNNILIFDELQFAKKGITEKIYSLLKDNFYIIGAGLNLDFKGETFGEMGDLIALADRPNYLIAACEFCGETASRTFRLIKHNKGYWLPAHYNAKVYSPEGEEETEKYFAVCSKHHIVPGHPNFKDKDLEKIKYSEEMIKIKKERKQEIITLSHDYNNQSDLEYLTNAF